MPIFFRAVAEGSLYSVIPNSADVLNPLAVLQPLADGIGLRCRNSWYLDAVWTARHAGNMFETMKVEAEINEELLNGLGINEEQLAVQHTRPRLLWPCETTSVHTPQSQRFVINSFGCITLTSGDIGLQSGVAFPYLDWYKPFGVCVDSTEPGYSTWGSNCIEDLARDPEGSRHCEASQFVFRSSEADSRGDIMEQMWSNEDVRGEIVLAQEGRQNRCAEAMALGHIRLVNECDGRAQQVWVYDREAQTISAVVPTVAHPHRRMCLTVSSTVVSKANRPMGLVPLDLSKLVNDCSASEYGSILR